MDRHAMGRKTENSLCRQTNPTGSRQVKYPINRHGSATHWCKTLQEYTVGKGPNAWELQYPTWLFHTSCTVVVLVFFTNFKTSPQLLRLFWRMLKCQRGLKPNSITGVCLTYQPCKVFGVGSPRISAHLDCLKRKTNWGQLVNPLFVQMHLNGWMNICITSVIDSISSLRPIQQAPSGWIHSICKIINYSQAETFLYVSRICPANI